MKGYPLANVQSKKPVAFSAVLLLLPIFIRYDLPINEPVFWEVG